MILQAIHYEGAARWYALRVSPRCEEGAENWLAERGVYAFHPVVWRKVKRFGQIKDYAVRYLPGYVFARFGGDPIPHRVQACPYIVGALQTKSGLWGALDPKDLRGLHARRKLDPDQMAQRKGTVADAAARILPEIGAKALFARGMFAGQVGEVVGLSADGGAKVELTLFGRVVEVSARAADLCPAKKTD